MLYTAGGIRRAYSYLYESKAFSKCYIKPLGCRDDIHARRKMQYKIMQKKAGFLLIIFIYLLHSFI